VARRPRAAAPQARSQLLSDAVDVTSRAARGGEFTLALGQPPGVVVSRAPITLLLQVAGREVPTSHFPCHFASVAAWSGRGSGIAANDGFSGQNPESTTPMTVPFPASGAAPKRCLQTPFEPVRPSRSGEWSVLAPHRQVRVDAGDAHGVPKPGHLGLGQVGGEAVEDRVEGRSDPALGHCGGRNRLFAAPSEVRAVVRTSAVRAGRAPCFGRVARIPDTPPVFEATGLSASWTMYACVAASVSAAVPTAVAGVAAPIGRARANATEAAAVESALRRPEPPELYSGNTCPLSMIVCDRWPPNGNAISVGDAGQRPDFRQISNKLMKSIDQNSSGD
jgi:hypothetical protein